MDTFKEHKCEASCEEVVNKDRNDPAHMGLVVKIRREHAEMGAQQTDLLAHLDNSGGIEDTEHEEDDDGHRQEHDDDGTRASSSGGCYSFFRCW